MTRALQDWHSLNTCYSCIRPSGYGHRDRYPQSKLNGLFLMFREIISENEKSVLL